MPCPTFGVLNLDKNYLSSQTPSPPHPFHSQPMTLPPSRKQSSPLQRPLDMLVHNLSPSSVFPLLIEEGMLQDCSVLMAPSPPRLVPLDIQLMSSN